MASDPLDSASFRARLLTSPGERQDVDYKSSLPFVENDAFSLKLLRHMQGMANAGGGWLVIGYAESADGIPYPDPSHQESLCASYEPTQLGEKADRTVSRGQQLKITVYFEGHPETNIHYPIIQVAGFNRLPYVCRSDRTANGTNERILRQGAVYVRRPRAETSEISTLADWEELISRCVQSRRDEFIEEFRALFERMSNPSGALAVPTAHALEVWTDSIRRRALNA